MEEKVNHGGPLVSTVTRIDRHSCIYMYTHMSIHIQHTGKKNKGVGSKEKEKLPGSSGQTSAELPALLNEVSRAAISLDSMRQARLWENSPLALPPSIYHVISVCL